MKEEQEQVGKDIETHRKDRYQKTCGEEEEEAVEDV